MLCLNYLIRGALPTWTPAPAGEALKVPSDMTGVSFVQ